MLAAGSHTLSVTFTPTDPGYSPQTATVTLVVTKAVLTVTAANQTITYGTTVAPYTATIAGYVNGDTSTVVNGTPLADDQPGDPGQRRQLHHHRGPGHPERRATTASRSATAP